MFEGASGELHYPGGAKGALRLISGIICATSLVGFTWVLSDDVQNPVAVTALVVLGVPCSYLAWVFLRGVLDRRSSIALEEGGLSIIAPGGTLRSIPWTDVRALHHVGRTVDQHLRLRLRGKRRSVRIYYDLERAAATLEEIAGRVHGAEDEYSLPFTARRPSVLRVLLWPVVVAVPCFAVGVVALVNGVATPFIILGLMGGFLVVGSLMIRGRQPLEVLVSEFGLAVRTATSVVDRVSWNDIIGLRLGFSDKQPHPPVLLLQAKGVGSLAIEVRWVDPIRLYGLLERTWCTIGKGASLP